MTEEVNAGNAAGVDTSATQVETTEQHDEQAAQTENSAPSENTDDPSAQPKRKGVGKRIDELVRQREEARRDREEALRALEYYRNQQTQTPQTKAEEAPDPSKFDTYEAYTRAVARWEVRQELKQEREANERRVREEAQRHHLTTARSQFDEKAETVREKYQDFDEVFATVMDDGFPMGQGMAQAIMDSTVGPELAYYLGSNEKEAARIARLSPVAQIREIGRLEAKLTATPPPAAKPSNAPPPINPVGNKGRADKSPDQMTDSEWVKWREGQLKKR